MKRWMTAAVVMIIQASYASERVRAEQVQIQFVCEYVLEQGETVQSLAIGDHRNWRFERVTDIDGAVHLLFSIRDDAPISSNLFLTNALIFTDRRNLELQLASPGRLKILPRPPLPPLDHNDDQTPQENSK